MNKYSLSAKKSVSLEKSGNVHTVCERHCHGNSYIFYTITKEIISEASWRLECQIRRQTFHKVHHFGNIS